MRCDLKYVHAFTDRHGKRRHYFRRGRKKYSLPGSPGSPEFLAAYNSYLGVPAQPSDRPSRSGTLRHLRETYYASAEFQNLAQSTQREAKYVIEALCSHPRKSGGTRGDNPVSAIEKRHILQWRDALAKKPGAANKMLGVVKGFLSFGADRGFRPDNPALGIKPLKVGRFRAWMDEELLAFEECWPLGTLERTGYALALYTGQRRADLVRMKWTDIAGDVLRVRQQKTSTAMEIFIHDELKVALSAVFPRSDAAILVGAKRKALNPIYFGAIMAAAI